MTVRQTAQQTVVSYDTKQYSSSRVSRPCHTCLCRAGGCCKCYAPLICKRMWKFLWSRYSHVKKKSTLYRDGLILLKWVRSFGTVMGQIRWRRQECNSTIASAMPTKYSPDGTVVSVVYSIQHEICSFCCLSFMSRRLLWVPYSSEL